MAQRFDDASLKEYMNCEDTCALDVQVAKSKHVLFEETIRNKQISKWKSNRSTSSISAECLEEALDEASSSRSCSSTDPRIDIFVNEFLGETEESYSDLIRVQKMYEATILRDKQAKVKAIKNILPNYEAPVLKRVDNENSNNNYMESLLLQVHEMLGTCLIQQQTLLHRVNKLETNMKANLIAIDENTNMLHNHTTLLTASNVTSKLDEVLAKIGKLGILETKVGELDEVVVKLEKLGEVVQKFEVRRLMSKANGNTYAKLVLRNF